MQNKVKYAETAGFAAVANKVLNSGGGGGATNFGTAVTVGATKGQYATVREAIDNGKSNILVIEDTAETGTASIILPNTNKNIAIRISENLTWDTSSIDGSVIVMPPAIGSSFVYLETLPNSKIIFTPKLDFIGFVSSVVSGTANTPNNQAVFSRGDFNIDMSGVAPAREGESILRNIGTVYSTGITQITLPNNASCGIRYVAVNTAIEESAEIIFIGAGTNSAPILEQNTSTATAIFNNQISLKGTFSDTVNVININAIFRNGILCNTSNTNLLLNLGGYVNGISSLNPATVINVTVNANNTQINNAKLNGGNLNIDSKTGFKGYGIYDYNVINIAPDSTINGHFAISDTPTPATILSREQKLYLGGANGEVYQFIGNATAQPILINTPPFRFSLTKTFSPSVTVNNGTGYNLFTTVTAGDITGATTTNMEYIPSKFAFQNTNLALLFPPFRNYTDYRIRVQLEGTIGGSFGSDRQFSLELRRGADNSLVLEDYVVKINDNDLTGLTRNYTSFVNGLSDPYITGGLRIVLNNASGTAITLTGFSLLVQGVSTNFIQ